MNKDDKNTCKLDISLDKFKEIIFKEQEKNIKDLSPIDYLITDSNYELSIKNKKMLINLNLKILTLKKELIKIKLLNKTAIVISTNVDNANIGFDGDYYSFFSKSIGEYSINIKYLLNIKELSDLKSIELTALANSKIKLILPYTDNYNISPYIAISETIKNNQKIVDFYVKKENIRILWGNINKKEETKVKKLLTSIIHSNSQTIIDITDSSVSYNSKVTCNIYQTPISKLELVIKDAQIITITGNNIKNYDIKENNGKNQASIYFEHEIEGKYNFNIYYEKELKLNENLINISSLSIKNAERDEGYLTISSKTVSDLEFIDLNNIRIIDINELPDSLKQNKKIKEALKYLITPYEFTLKLIKHKKIAMPESSIKNAIFNTVILKKGVILHSIFLEIKNNSKPFIQIELDKSTIPLSSFIKGKPVKPIKSEDGNIMLSLPKFTSSNQSFWIEVILISTMNKIQKTGSIDIILPKFDITISHLYWKLYLPYKFKYKKFKGNIEKLDYFNTEPPEYPYYYNDENYDKSYNLMEKAESSSYLYDEFEEAQDFEEEACITTPPKRELAKLAPAPMPIMSKSMATAGSIAPKQKKRTRKMVKQDTQANKPIVKKLSSSGFIQKQVGKIPVKINMPLIGEISYYEKLFVENENIKLSFNYKRTKKEEVKPL